MLLQRVWRPTAGGQTQRDYMKLLKPSQPACNPALLLPDLYLHAKHGSEVGCAETAVRLCELSLAYVRAKWGLYAGPSSFTACPQCCSAIVALMPLPADAQQVSQVRECEI